MEPTEIADLAIFLAFVLGLALATGRLAWRLWRYHQQHIPWPKLAGRDIIAFGGLLLPFVLILLARAIPLPVADELSWRIMTGVPALIAVYTLVYFEWFVIER